MKRVVSLWALAALLAGAAAADGEVDPREILEEAKRAAHDIPRQAEALAALAWDEASHPLVRAAAREELVGFGSYGLAALRATLKRVDPLLQADVVAAFLDARRQEPSGDPPDFRPGLDEAIWFGSIEAQRLAIAEISRYNFPPAVLNTVDAIHTHPELTVPGIRALGRLQDERARFFLDRVLQHGEPRYQREAARALGQIGDAGLLILRQGARSASRTTREAAVGGLLPLATTEDLTLLHEYVVDNAEDDPAVLERVRLRATELEAQLEEQQLQEAASGAPDP
jgi:HEAT repeat protein